ncbi:MAG: signal peptidase II [Erysipelotrichaceae bacterium]
MKRYINYLVIVIIIVLLDLLSKAWADNVLQPLGSMEIIPGFFNLTYVQNTGGAWGLLAGNMLIFIIIGIVAIFGFIYYYLKHSSDRLTQIASFMMLAGAIGNFIDRIVFSYVRDMFDFIIFGYDFPVFNIADISLVLGCGLLLISVILEIRDESNN